MAASSDDSLERIRLGIAWIAIQKGLEERYIEEFGEQGRAEIDAARAAHSS